MSELKLEHFLELSFFYSLDFISAMGHWHEQVDALRDEGFFSLHSEKHLNAMCDFADQFEKSKACQSWEEGCFVVKRCQFDTFVQLIDLSASVCIGESEALKCSRHKKNYVRVGDYLIRECD